MDIFGITYKIFSQYSDFFLGGGNAHIAELLCIRNYLTDDKNIYRYELNYVELFQMHTLSLSKGKYDSGLVKAYLKEEKTYINTVHAQVNFCPMIYERYEKIK